MLSTAGGMSICSVRPPAGSWPRKVMDGKIADAPFAVLAHALDREPGAIDQCQPGPGAAFAHPPQRSVGGRQGETGARGVAILGEPEFELGLGLVGHRRRGGARPVRATLPSHRFADEDGAGWGE